MIIEKNAIREESLHVGGNILFRNILNTCFLNPYHVTSLLRRAASQMTIGETTLETKNNKEGHKTASPLEKVFSHTRIV